jgi:2-isopropylmalate synthase
LYDLFVAEYLNVRGSLRLISHDLGGDSCSPNQRQIRARIEENGEEKDIKGVGNGPLDAFVDALRSHCGLDVDIGDYCEHSLGQGANAEAMAYVELTQKGASPVYGAGKHPSILRAGLEAIVSALNAIKEKS